MRRDDWLNNYQYENGMKKIQCWILRSGLSCFGSGAHGKRNGSVATSSSTPISLAMKTIGVSERNRREKPSPNQTYSMRDAYCAYHSTK